MRSSSISYAVVAILLAHAGRSAAEPVPRPAPGPEAIPEAPAKPDGGYHPLVLGAFAGFGMATSIREDPPGAPRPRLAGNGGVYLGFHLSKVLSLEVGLGLIGKGNGREFHGERYQIEVLELPIGARWDIGRFRVGVAVALDVAVAGLTRVCDDGSHDCKEIKWSDDSYTYWEDYERFNFGPRVALGYSFPIGRAALVPSVAWSMDVLDNTRNAEDECALGYCRGMRNMNLMLELGVEYGFGG